VVKFMTDMKLLSVNVSLPREASWGGKAVTTGIFKRPVPGRVLVRTLNLEGDRQADLRVHGGPDKAVYAYPSEHYSFWRSELPQIEFRWGMFGENLTTVGLLENEVNIGDRFRIGSVELIATQPRMPCYKLNVRFGRRDIVRRFLRSRRTGLYFAVEREGEIGAGDSITRLGRDKHDMTVADITRLYLDEKRDMAMLRRALGLEALPDSWREYFREQIARVEMQRLAV
jgi:MOSC domain-containing protein YiiM